MSTLENGVLLALVALLPLVVLTLTSFVKLSVVLSLVRNAIGTPDAPSGLVVTGLSLVLTFFVMAPVAVKMVQAAASAPTQPAPAPRRVPAPGPGGATAPGTAPTGAATAAVPTAGGLAAGAPAAGAPAAGAPAAGAPAAGGLAAGAPAAGAPTGAPTAAAPAAGAPTAGAPPTGAPTPGAPTAGAPVAEPPTMDAIDAALRALVPPQYQGQLAAVERAFEPLRDFLIKHTRVQDRETFGILATQLGNTVRGDELYVMAPAFIATELREAFAIAVLIFIPFLVIDLIVALGLASMGLVTTSPQTVALPLKLILFVAVDGWRLLLDALLRGYV